MKRLLTAALLGALATGSMAAEMDDAAARAAIQSLVPDAKIDSIAESRLPGFYEVAVAGQVVYVSGDGKYLVQGMVYDIQEKVDLTEVGKAKIRRAALVDMPQAQRIVFGPKDPKHTVTVFTDIDCGYCRRMHDQMDEYNELGIAIEYLMFPRAGAGSESWQKAVSVWCSDDRNNALTEAKAGAALDKKECANPVQAHYEMGGRVGVTGTPMIIAPNGTQLGGYVPPEQLAKRLEELAAAKGKS